MRIKKTFQGSLPENKIVETYTESDTDTYNCNYLNNKIISDSGNGYIRYADGTQICYGESSGIDGTYRTVTFAKPFKTNSAVYVTATPILNGNNFVIHCQIGAISNSQFTMRIFYQSSNGGGWGVGSNTFQYMAIGVWK